MNPSLGLCVTPSELVKVENPINNTRQIRVFTKVVLLLLNIQWFLLNLPTYSNSS